jgi:hypothetical protein
MPQYLVNTNTDSNNNHEVHETTCNHLPEPRHRIGLGYHSDCRAALRAAKNHYVNVDGCYHCWRPCHTG